ncbi:uncharacterized protein LOC117291313 [Asterias rubens]|uniref:uncharacterized protein LOC117291313 n=1 Tax=Asterias rubens TaxID=7604 RepID=UPI0014558965|nr:uncharacterized protein LOC117291313 [Asterias rubens]
MAATRVSKAPDPMDVVIQTNMGVNSIGDGQWRPLSSISHHTDNSHLKDPKETDNFGEEGYPGTVSLRSKSRVSIAPIAPSNEEPIQVQGFSSYPPRDPPPTRAVSTASHRVNPARRRSHRLRTAPGKMERRTTELHKAFVTMDARNRVTVDVIKGSARTSANAFDDRVCRPYSVYTVTQQCERLAISPFGGPLMNSAAGRYRERYLTKHRPDVVQDGTRGGSSNKTTFQRFYDNLDLLAINVKRIPFGTLRKPPPKQARKADSQTKSVPTQLHKYTSERIANLHESMDRQDGPSSPRINGKQLSVMGVEYKVAMEVSSNLEKHRMSRPSNVPGLPNLSASRTDAPRLQIQSERLLTLGEQSLKDGISSNLFDSDRSKRGPIKAIEKPPRRVKSPPLSKLSREKFYPEAQRRREQGTWAELRIGRPVTPPASEYTAVQSASFVTTARPLTSMTSRTGVSESEEKTQSTKGKTDELPKLEDVSSEKEISETGRTTPDKNKQSEEEKTHDVNRDQFETLPDDPVVGVSQEGERDACGTPLSSRSLVITVPDGDCALGEDNDDAIGEVTDELGVVGETGSEITDGEKIVSTGTEEYSENTVDETVGEVEHNQDEKTNDQLDESIDLNQSVEVDGQSDDSVEHNPVVDHDCQPKETGSKNDTRKPDEKPDEPVEQSENPNDVPSEPGDDYTSGNIIDLSVEQDGQDQLENPKNQSVELVEQDTSVGPDDQPNERIEQEQNMNNDNEIAEPVDNGLVENVYQI